MRAGPDSWLWVVVLLLASVAGSRAEDAKPAAATSPPAASSAPAANPAAASNASAQANPAGSLFQSLSLGSNKGPVHIDSDTLELDYKSSNVYYRGHV